MRLKNLRWKRSVAGVIALALVATACTSGSEPELEDTGAVEAKIVAPDYGAATFFVNVDVTDEGFEPSTIFIPAGQQVRLVMRNRGTAEHHFRVSGLVVEQLSWYVPSDIDEMDLLAMTDAELAELEISAEEDLEHVGHHLSPSFMPFKAESPSGVSPLPGEVHGYARPGGYDVLESSRRALAPSRQKMC